VYQAIDESTHAAAALLPRLTSRRPNLVLTTSVMASHKGIETVVGAIALVRQAGVPAELRLVGAWPDRRYERFIRRTIAVLGLEAVVDVRGHVPRDELNRLYAEASVFCLMSRCESFGIPAVEAQAFGTPVVSSRCCAIPEVCGDGGRYEAPGDVGAVARVLLDLLGDSRSWSELSARARANAARFRWEQCSRPLAAALVA
jgi:glycosyltransferase involved in cell wall biosynthesis